MRLLTIYIQWRPKIPYNSVNKSIQLDQKILQIDLTVPTITIKILYNTDQEHL